MRVFREHTSEQLLDRLQKVEELILENNIKLVSLGASGALAAVRGGRELSVNVVVCGFRLWWTALQV